MYEKTCNGGDAVILLPCTGSKGDEAAPAIELYSPIGAIAAVKSALQHGDYDEGVDTFFISAKHGIINVGEIIEPYDRELKEDDVADISQQVGELLEERDYDYLFSFVDGLYSRAVGEVAYRQKTQ